VTFVPFVNRVHTTDVQEREETRNFIGETGRAPLTVAIVGFIQGGPESLQDVSNNR